MQLTTALKKFADDSMQRHPGEAQETMKSAIEALKATDILEKAFKTGDMLPNMTLINAKGQEVALQDLYSQERLVIIFYRGGWCPYCNLELKAFESVLPQLKAIGARLVAIGPELPDNSLTTTQKNELSFEVLSDTDNALAAKMNLLYPLPDDLVQLYSKFGIDLVANQGNQANSLPIAATYIIEKDGTISFHFLEEDYKLRADPETVLAAL